MSALRATLAATLVATLSFGTGCGGCGNGEIGEGATGSTQTDVGSGGRDSSAASGGGGSSQASGGSGAGGDLCVPEAADCTGKCGPVDVGCGESYACPPCLGGLVCEDATNTCVTVEQACGDFECGLIADACGQPIIDCGGCEHKPGTQCNGGTHTCVDCEPPTCDADQCGTVANGCGDTAECGACDRPGTYCNPFTHACEVCKTECAPTDCGQVPTGCGSFLTCPACEPVTPPLCVQLGLECGVATNPCTGEVFDCGGCTDNGSCVDGLCEPCQEGCCCADFGAECGVVVTPCGAIDCGGCENGYCGGIEANQCYGSTCTLEDDCEEGQTCYFGYCCKPAGCPEVENPGGGVDWCGDHADNCGGTVSCGGCADPSAVCDNAAGGVCCVPQDPELYCAQNLLCGSGHVNNCHQPIDCPDDCASGVCTSATAGTCCQPQGCQQNWCGSHGDGCGGTVPCGGCDLPAICTAGGVCCTSPQSPAEIAAFCTSYGYCGGGHYDNCNQPIDCPDECASGVCTAGGTCCNPNPNICHDANTCAGSQSSCGLNYPCDAGDCDGNEICTAAGSCCPQNPNICHDTNTCAGSQSSCGQNYPCDAGHCDANETCTAAGTCCPPYQCSSSQCGAWTDGCSGELVDCGDNCGDGYVCSAATSGFCQPAACEPTITCAGHCGNIPNDGCGNPLNCPGCSGSLHCNSTTHSCCQPADCDSLPCSASGIDGCTGQSYSCPPCG